jgi:pimeloyl-ACP methyl ester carboxylesterase
MVKICSMSRGAAVAIIVGVITGLCSARQADASPSREHAETFQDIKVSVRGEGRPVLMIPGLNSAGAVWDETCEKLKPSGVQCHIVQLPGFAGQSPLAKVGDGYLAAMRDRLLAYIDARNLKDAVVMGHSLGGEVGMQMAIKEPLKVSRLVIVDSLPFFAAIRAPKATSESMKPMADGMRASMLSSPVEAYNTQLKANLVGMTRDAKRIERLAKWGLASDRATTAQAMYEIFTIDLRDDLSRLRQPTLVLGAWAAYAQFGSTKDSVRKTFADQYAKLEGVRIELSETGYHFLMWDDPDWLVAQVAQFLGKEGAKPATTTAQK